MRKAATDAATRLGLWTDLRTPRTAAELARARGLDPIATAWLLAGLAADGLLLRDGDAYRATSDGSDHAEGGGLLAEVLQRRSPLAWTEIAGNPAAAALTIPLAPPSGALVRAVVAELASALATGGTFLDLGCGTGEHTEAVLDAAPLGTATLVDRPAMLSKARVRLARFGARVALAPGDLTAFAGVPCNAVLLSQVVHLLRAAEAAELLRRVTRTLAPNGVVAIVDVDVDTPATATADTAWFALSLLVHGLPGLVSRAELTAWCTAAGLLDVTARPFPGRPGIVLVTGRGPRSTLFAD